MNSSICSRRLLILRPRFHLSQNKNILTAGTAVITAILGASQYFIISQPKLKVCVSGKPVISFSLCSNYWGLVKIAPDLSNSFVVGGSRPDNKLKPREST